MATEFLRPDADDTDGNWTSATTGTGVNLFAEIDETSASDSDFIRSGANPSNDVCKIRLSNPASAPQEPMDVLYRYKKTGTGQIDLRVRLLQATTEIASWTHTNISSSYVDGSQTLTTPQFNSISDFNDLFLEFRATVPAPILDQIAASATAAYSTRKLRAAYGGSCLKVRRSTPDTTTLDIGFSGDNLDTASMLTFCGSGDGFVDTWYDQTGNGRNVTQATTGAQPKIISSGSLVTLNGKPAMDFDGTDDTLIGISGVDFNTLFNSLSQYTILNGSRGRAAGPGAAYNAAAVVGGAVSHIWQGYGSTTIEIGHYPAVSQSFSMSLPETVVMVSRFDGTSDLLEAWKNGGSSSDDTAANDIVSNQTLQIGSSSLGGFLNALVCEVFCFGSPITLSDINILGDSMAIYIGPTWTTAT